MSSFRPLSVVMIEHTGRGGVADYTQCLVSALASGGVDVEVVTARDTNMTIMEPVRVRPDFFFVREGNALRNLTRRLRLHKGINAAAYLLTIAKLVPLARRVDVVHFQGGVPLLAAISVLLFRATGARVVFTPHNTFERGRGWRRTTELCWRLSHRLIVHARADLANLPADVAAKTSVIPHGEYGDLPPAAITGNRHALRSRLGIPASATAVLVFGQLRPDKGVEDVLAAARLLPGLHVMVAGEDLGAAHVVRAASVDPDLAGRLHLSVGFQTFDEAADWFAAADATVLAYKVASQSGVLMLSYAFERPVVVYPVGGLPEAVRHQVTGWVTSAPDVRELAATLAEVNRVGTEGCTQMGRAAGKMAREEFGWKEIAAKTIDLYQDLVDRRGVTSSQPAA